jgi:NO-binding membrane sensor protein with MHYT domain
LVASIVIGLVGGAIALLSAKQCLTLKDQAAGGGLLTLAICGMHFTAMAAVTVAPNSAATVPHSLMSNIRWPSPSRCSPP